MLSYRCKVGARSVKGRRKPPVHVDTVVVQCRRNGVSRQTLMHCAIYRNDDGHLPDIAGRIWYEADINYVSGFRGVERILYSNDGLIFITRDHYNTFIEIVKPDNYEEEQPVSTDETIETINEEDNADET